MLDELDVLKDISEKLSDAGIPFMLTGSMAMNYYAQPRMTRDIDIIVSIGKGDVQKILSLFSGQYYISKEAVQESVMHSSMFNIIHNESIIKIDFIILKDEPYRHNEFERRLLVKIRDFSTYLVSKEDLIISKLWWARDSNSELQKADVRNLMRTGFDEAYVQNWVRKLGLEKIYTRIKNE